jgi:hypothetical protein
VFSLSAVSVPTKMFLLLSLASAFFLSINSFYFDYLSIISIVTDFLIFKELSIIFSLMINAIKPLVILFRGYFKSY